MEDLLTVLAKFHETVVRPDMERLIEASERRLRDEMQSNFDALAPRLDRLETEYHMIVAGLKRLEERMDRMEKRLDKVALRSELVELKGRVEGLEQRIREIEDRLAD